jgi:hypothetical protein
MAENLIMAVVIRDAEKPPPPCPLPAWARASDARVDASDCALFAGAALAALDPIVRANAPFAGVWRQRLALRAAAATVRMTGRREAEADLRDAWYLRAKGDALVQRANICGLGACWRRNPACRSKDFVTWLCALSSTLRTPSHRSSRTRRGQSDPASLAATCPAPRCEDL